MRHLKELILIGAGGHARSCIDVIESEGKYRVAGIVGLREELGKKIDGYEVIALDEDLEEISKKYEYALITIGQIKSADPRIKAYENVKKNGLKLATIISPTAHVSTHADIGPGTIIMHGAIVNSGASVRENCIVNTRALIEHDSRISSHCHISTGALINGGVSIDEGCFIGSGSVIKERITIGKCSIVGMTTKVRRNLPPNSFFLGGENHES
jgi:sugar O-acyltransferase (sialic acid O-acetyltransferase NeuD family)